MLKSDLIGYIKKYYLEGNCKSVKWSVKDKNLSVIFLSEDTTLLGQLNANIDLDDNEFGIYNTDSLLSLFGALDNDMNIQYHYEKNKIVGLRFSDDLVSATYMLADLSIIPQTREIKSLPEFDIEIELKKDLIDRFIKSRKSLTDAKIVALLPDMDSVDFVINFSLQPSNRISVPFPATVTNAFSQIAFNVDYLTNIFSSNGTFKNATLKVSEKGLMMVKFEDEDYNTMYLVKSVELS